jgi:peptidoglycan/xylan/chitin deacetylase (PgdA/CDA1 family)
MSIIPILMYHNINCPPQGARLRNLYVRKNAFARQMFLLRLLGYRGLSMSAAMPYLRGEKKGRVAVLTFDDGYVDTLENALPILQKNGFSATPKGRWFKSSPRNQ